MKHLLTLIALAVLFVTTSPAHSQELTQICTQKSGLYWTANTEPDMNKYRVYASNNPIDVTADNTTLLLMEVPHDPNAGSSLSTKLNSELAEGDKYFRISAVDNVGNESGLSDEASCRYDKIPGTPMGVTIIFDVK